jgi:glycosyltransferase involved in cell wall biosynthesis
MGFEIRGWVSTVVIMLFLGEVQLLTIGIIGESISRICDEVKQRPLYVVRRSLNYSVELIADLRGCEERGRFDFVSSEKPSIACTMKSGRCLTSS